MKALQVLVEEGNKAKNKKSKVTPAPTMDQPLLVAWRHHFSSWVTVV
jgi:hypothetical protein